MFHIQLQVGSVVLEVTGHRGFRALLSSIYYFLAAAAA